MEESEYFKAKDKARSKAYKLSYDNKIKLLKENGWTNRGHWDNWFDPSNGWNYSLDDAATQIFFNKQNS